LPGHAPHGEAHLAAAEAAFADSMKATDMRSASTDTDPGGGESESAFPENDPDVAISGGGGEQSTPDPRLDPNTVPDDSRWTIPEPKLAPRDAPRPHVIRVTPKR
jgi:hypothetical protein